MCRDLHIARMRFGECEYAPSYAGLFALLEYEAYRCRAICGDCGFNSDAVIARLANSKSRGLSA